MRVLEKTLFILIGLVYVLCLIVSIVQNNILGIGAFISLIISIINVCILYKCFNQANEDVNKLVKKNMRLQFLLDVEKTKNKEDK